MSKLLIPLLILALSSTPGFAQHYSNHWYFGDKAGLTFNQNNTPTPTTDGVLSTIEGCATLSDSAGNLQMYTDGSTVYNSKHQVMANGKGLHGNATSSQSAIIVPQPNSTTNAYIFTVDHSGGPNGLEWNLVDLTKNNGLGEVVIKNQTLTTPTTEKLTAVAHSNGKDYWVVTHLWNSDAFYAYQVTSQGINSAPVISSVGSVLSGAALNALGCMKISPDGSKLAMATEGTGLVEVFDFDNSTGQLTNAKKVVGNYQWAYGVEFSPSGRYLYFSMVSPGKIYQADLKQAGNPAIINKVTLIAQSASFAIGALQLGPDYRIYIARYSSPHLGVINMPENPGTSSQYIDDGIFLNNRTSYVGLPGFVQSWYQVSIPSASVTADCINQPAIFEITQADNADSALWIFGDGASSTIYPPFTTITHNYSSAGTYNVVLYLFSSTTGTDTLNKTATLLAPPDVNLGNDTVLCAGNALGLNGGSATTYSWQDGSTSANYMVAQDGQYWVTAQNQCGVDSDSIQVKFELPPAIHLTADTFLCKGDTIQLSGMADHTQHFGWTSHGTNSTIDVSKEGSYVFYAFNSCGLTQDTVMVDVLTPPQVSLGNDTLLCDGSTITFAVNPTGYTLNWENGSDQGVRTIGVAGNYSVTLQNQCGTSSDTIRVSTAQSPTLELGTDVQACQGEAVTIVAEVGNANDFSWSRGQESYVLTTTESGTYVATATNACGTVMDTVNVRFHELPVSELPESFDWCPEHPMKVSAGANTNDYLWSNGSTGPDLTPASPGVYYVNITGQGGCSVVDSVNVSENCIATDYLIPNAFTPNGDGLNDLFQPLKGQPVNNVSYQIFNRWGETIYSAGGETGWDGKYNGNEQPIGSYVYIITFTDSYGIPHRQQGSVTIVR